jgi:hypothetical protein
MTFATAIHDRIYLLAERYDLFEVSLQGEPLMNEVVAAGGGAILMGAHMGSFEVLRWIGEHRAGLGLAMTMYEDNARKVNAMLAALAPRHPPEIIAVGHIDAMLKIRARLDQGAMVGMLADRSFGDEGVLPVTFLGATAYLPTGPMRAAAMLRRRVIFMLGLYRGGNRYHVVFEALADFSTTPAARARRRSKRRSRATRRCWSSTAAAIPTTGSTSSISGAAPRLARAARAAAAAAARMKPQLWRWACCWRPRRAAAPPRRGPRQRRRRRQLDQLMSLMAQRRHGEADFSETKYLSMLKQPLESSGLLIYDAPIIWNSAPRCRGRSRWCSITAS